MVRDDVGYCSHFKHVVDPRYFIFVEHFRMIVVVSTDVSYPQMVTLLISGARQVRWSFDCYVFFLHDLYVVFCKNSRKSRVAHLPY